MSIIVFESLLGVFDFYLVYLFLKSFLGRLQINNKVFKLIVLVSIITLAAVNAYENAILNIIVSTFLYIIVASCFKKGIKSTVLVVGFYTIMILLLELIVSLIMMVILEQYNILNEKYTYSYMVTLSVMKLVTFFVVKLTNRYKGYEMFFLPKIFSIVLYTIPLVSCVLVISISYTYFEMNPNFVISGAISLLSILYINIVIFIIFEKVNKLEKENLDNKLLEQEVKYKDEYYQNVEKNQSELRELRHNLKNQVLGIKYLLSESNDPIVRELLKELDEDTNIFTENPIVNSILDSKVKEAKSKNIIVENKVIIPNKLNISCGDMGIVIGNLLDNAIEANENLEQGNEKKIYIEIIYINKCLLIEVRNPSYKSGKPEFAFGMSSKSDTENHGIGLKSVSKILSKYNGNLEIEHAKDFVVNVMFQNIE